MDQDQDLDPDSDPDPDPSFFVTDLQEASKKLFFCYTIFSACDIYIIFQRKNVKRITK